MWEVPHKQQIHDFLKAAALGGVASKIVDAVTTEGELAFVGNLIAFIHHITVHVRNIRNALHPIARISLLRSRALRVTLVQFRIDGIDALRCCRICRETYGLPWIFLSTTRLDSTPFTHQNAHFGER